jgi:curved DNA-binding protein CbpA
VNPFEALGLPERGDLTDEQVRAAWRKVAAATHPDRADGGDLARYTAAATAYVELRTGWSRSEALADLRDARDDTTPLPVIPAMEAPPPPYSAPPLGLPAAIGQLPARIRRGRPVRLFVRAAVAAALALVVLRLIPGKPAAPADIAGLVVWFLLTGRSDLAPPPEQ